MVVATALAADRTLAAAPEAVKPVTNPSLARTLVAKLTTQLQRSVPATSIQPVRRMERVAAPTLVIREGASGIRAELAPFQFPLPPPSL